MNNSDCIFVDETEKVIEKMEEIEPLNFRKERLASRSPTPEILNIVEGGSNVSLSDGESNTTLASQDSNEDQDEFLGRPFKRIRTEDSSVESSPREV